MSLPPAVRRLTIAWPVIARLVIGGIYTVFGLLKLVDIDGTTRSVRAYRILPEALVPFTGTVMPVLEVCIGVLLLLGLVIRPAALVAGVMSLCFFAAIVSVWARGLKIECGCFGNSGGTPHPVPGYIRELVINAVVMICAGYLVRRPDSPFSLDRILGLTSIDPDIETT